MELVTKWAESKTGWKFNKGSWGRLTVGWVESQQSQDPVLVTLEMGKSYLYVLHPALLTHVSGCRTHNVSTKFAHAPCSSVLEVRAEVRTRTHAGGVQPSGVEL